MSVYLDTKFSKRTASMIHPNRYHPLTRTHNREKPHINSTYVTVKLKI